MRCGNAYPCVELIRLMHQEAEAYTQMRDMTGAFQKITPEDIVLGTQIVLGEEVRLRFDYLVNDKGEKWIPLFTDKGELEKSTGAHVTINMPIEEMIREGLRCDIVAGVVINPFGEQLVLTKKALKMICEIKDKQVNQS